jgi:glycosyltransferase involved in cell wall biosynthesis
MVKTPVVFATTVFEQPDHGPAVYARYLWEAFRTSEEFDFHVVAPSFAINDPRLHATGIASSSAQLYRRVTETTLRIASQLGLETIIHANNTHPFAGLDRYPGQWIAQVNDYEVARVWRDFPRNVFRYQPRRMMSIAWRHGQEKRAMAAAARIVCNSDFTRSECLRAYPHAEPERFVTIHKGVDTQRFIRPEDASRSPQRSQSGELLRLLFIGSNWQLKGLPELLAALKTVVEQFPNVVLDVVGAVARPAVDRLSRRHGVEHRVHIRGHVSRDELPRVFWNSDVLVMPSRLEAFGVAAIEAMAAGIPVIATRVGGLAEIITTNRNGILVEPNKVDQLSRAICELLGNPQLRRDLAAAGCRRAEDFSIHSMIAKVQRLYEGMRGCRHRPRVDGAPV